MIHRRQAIGNVCLLNLLRGTDIKWVRLEIGPGHGAGIRGQGSSKGLSGNRKNLPTIFYQIQLPRSLGAESARVQVAEARRITHIQLR